jgi:hypothetical protein
MRRAVIFAVIFSMLLGTTGCEALKKKFTRKKKEVVKMPRIYQVKKYEKRPTPELYKKHYVYWMTWHSELLKVLGKNRKKDTLCINEIVGNLKDMEAILVKSKADELRPHIERLEKVRDIIIIEELSQANKAYVQRVLETEDRAIKREFTYKKVKDYFRTSFEDEA